jgi:hypothetical protein
VELEEKQKELYQSLLNMIEWTEYYRESCKKVNMKELYSEKSWAKNHATLKVCLPRQSGHTTFAKQLILNKYKDAVYILPDIIDWRHTKISTMSPRQKSRCCNIFNIRRIMGITPDIVIVDCASFLSKSNIDLIYNMFSRYAYENDKFLFLFLE